MRKMTLTKSPVPIGKLQWPSSVGQRGGWKMPSKRKVAQGNALQQRWKMAQIGNSWVDGKRFALGAGKSSLRWFILGLTLIN